MGIGIKDPILGIPGAVPATSGDLAAKCDIVHHALPMRRYRTIPAQGPRGKIVIDAMNYWHTGEVILEDFEAAPDFSAVAIRIAGTTSAAMDSMVRATWL